MEKETRKKSKIRPFPTPETHGENSKWQETFRRQLRREAEEWERELENNPELDDIDAPPELFDKIVAQLKAEGKWEDEGKEAAEIRAEAAGEKGVEERGRSENALPDKKMLEKEKKEAAEIRTEAAGEKDVEERESSESALSDKKMQKILEEDVTEAHKTAGKRTVGKGTVEKGTVEKEALGEEIAEELTPDIYAMLSEKDREALEIGRKVQQRGKRRYIRKWCGAAAVVIVCVFLVTMSSEANRKYAAGLINRITGSRWGIYVEDSDRDTIKYSEDERKAYLDIEEQLGIAVPQLQYRPYGMEFQSYEINTEMKSGAIFYRYNGKLLTIYLYGRMKDTTMQQTLDAYSIDEFQMDSLEFPIKFYEIDDIEGDSYAGEITYNDCYYMILGKMEKMEFEKLLQNIIF